MITCNGKSTEWKSFDDIKEWATKYNYKYMISTDTLEVFDVRSLTFVEGKEVYSEPHTCVYKKVNE